MSELMLLEVQSIADNYNVSKHIVQKSVVSFMQRGKDFAEAKSITIKHIVADTKRIDPTKFSYNPNKL